jgi:hypothetical protein
MLSSNSTTARLPLATLITDGALFFISWMHTPSTNQLGGFIGQRTLRVATSLYVNAIMLTWTDETALLAEAAAESDRRWRMGKATKLPC